MARTKQVVEPSEAAGLTPAPAPEAKPARVVNFWKVHPGKVRLLDGAEIEFRTQKFTTADEELIKKIAAVMDRYRISTASGEKIQP